MASRGWAEIDTNFPTMQQRVADDLGRRIVAGAWQPGSPLPVEDALASELGVSRGVLREAVKSLVAKGMLRVRPRTGTRVLPPEDWNHLDPDVLRWKQSGDAAGLLRDTGELRRIVEPRPGSRSRASTSRRSARLRPTSASCASPTRDKLAVARHLDEFGVGFIEGGWPGANPRDTEFFARARQEIARSPAKPGGPEAPDGRTRDARGGEAAP